MPKKILNVPAISNPKKFGLEILTMLIANPNTNFVIRRDGEQVTMWIGDEENEQRDEP